MRFSLAVSVALLLLVSASFASTSELIQHYQAAVDNPQRPQLDKDKDNKRRPVKLLSFAGIEPGMTVLDIFAADGYYTELLARTLGNSGHVDALNNLAYIDFIGAETIRQRFSDKRLPNATMLTREADDLGLSPERYDRILLMLSFHDLYYVMPSRGWAKVDAQAFIEQLKTSLKSNGELIIVDHSSLPGRGTDDAAGLHRIEADFVKQQMQNWGFDLVEQAGFLQNLDDPMTIPIWDPKVRDRTNRFIFKFRKS